MKTMQSLLLLAVGCAGAIAFAAEEPKAADAKPAPAATVTNPPPRRASRDPANSNDVFYTLGPDSKPRDGVPKGKFTEAKVIPSNVFPGTQHTYWVWQPRPETGWSDLPGDDALALARPAGFHGSQ